LGVGDSGRGGWRDHGQRVAFAGGNQFGDPGGRYGGWGGRGHWHDFIAGCPWKHCFAPDHGHRFWGYADPYANWYGPAYGYWDDDDYDWGWWGGYGYRIDRTTSLIVAFLPLLGGALYLGNPWPAAYVGYEASPYYASYYGYGPGPRYAYRYADNAVFAVEPGSQRIEAITGLLAGDGWVVGSVMPAGYDFYNLPPEYRDRYADSDAAWYRYSDGYVYEVDPNTRIVRRSITLAVV
jgi:hypothetical protein